MRARPQNAFAVQNVAAAATALDTKAARSSFAIASKRNIIHRANAVVTSTFSAVYAPALGLPSRTAPSASGKPMKVRRRQTDNEAAGRKQDTKQIKKQASGVRSGSLRASQGGIIIARKGTEPLATGTPQKLPPPISLSPRSSRQRGSAYLEHAIERRGKTRGHALATRGDTASSTGRLPHPAARWCAIPRGHTRRSAPIAHAPSKASIKPV